MVIQNQADFMDDLKRNIERWKNELATAEFPEISEALNKWIADGGGLISEYEAIHGKKI